VQYISLYSRPVSVLSIYTIVQSLILHLRYTDIERQSDQNGTVRCTGPEV